MQDIYINWRRFLLKLGLFGPVGTGKTLTLLSIYKYLEKKVNISGKTNALDNKYTEFLQENRVSSTPKGGESESLRFTWDSEEIEIYTTAGEDFVDNSKTEKNLDSDQHYLIVINPFLFDEDLAARAFLDLVVSIQNIGSQSFSSACNIASEWLFGYKNDKLMQLKNDSDFTILFMEESQPKVYADLDFLLNKLKPFKWENLGSRISEDYTCAIKKFVAKAQNFRLSEKVNLKNFFQNAQNKHLIFSHTDLLKFMPTISENDFNKVFDSFFQNEERYTDQQILSFAVKSDIRAIESISIGEGKVYDVQLKMELNERGDWGSLFSILVNRKKSKNITSHQQKVFSHTLPKLFLFLCCLLWTDFSLQALTSTIKGGFAISNILKLLLFSGLIFYFFPRTIKAEKVYWGNIGKARKKLPLLILVLGFLFITSFINIGSQYPIQIDHYIGGLIYYSSLIIIGFLLLYTVMLSRLDPFFNLRK